MSRVGLDAGSRQVLLDLIYSLSLDDQNEEDGKSGKGKDEPRGEGKDKDGGDEKAPADDDDDARLRQRAKEARRNERELEKKEKVLRSALRIDRREGRGGGGNEIDLDDRDAGHPMVANNPSPAGEKIPITATSASGESKLLQIPRSSNLDTFFKAAKQKLKLGKTPNVAKMHAPPGMELVDTLSLRPGASVFVSFEKDRPVPGEKKGKEKASATDEGNLTAGDETNPNEGTGITGMDSPDFANESKDYSPEARLRLAAAARASGSKRNERRKRFTPGPAMDLENERLLGLLNGRRNGHKNGHGTPQRLPAHQKRDEIVDAIENSLSPVTLLTGETGSGKTTQVPKFIFEEYVAQKKGAEVNIVVAQPRRVAATSVARRVAAELGENVGETVGYVVKGDTCVSGKTRITFMTTGVLLRRLVTDETLECITHVFVDEVHERTAEADFLLSYLRDLVGTRTSGGEKKKHKLKVILMSATMASGTFEAYFNFGNGFGPIPKPHIEGRTFPVQERFMEDVFTGTSKGNFQGGKGKNNNNMKPGSIQSGFDSYANNLVFALPAILAETETGDDLTNACLVFLPGVVEIGLVTKMLEKSLPQRLWQQLHVLPLHGQLTGKEQQLAFDPPPHGKRKIVLATNVAETSLTIPDVAFVFDSGRVKKMWYDTQTERSSLRESWCSLVSSTQRKGRAGRVRPGVCVRLFTKTESSTNQPETDLPELQTAPLEGLVMHAMLTRPLADPEATLGKTPDPPSLVSIRSAVGRLISVGALAVTSEGSDDDKKNETKKTRLSLTPLGFHLAHLPIEPRLGKMLVYATVLGCLDPIVTIAASFGCKPIFGVDPLNKDAAVGNKRKIFAKESKTRNISGKDAESGDRVKTPPATGGARSDHLAVSKAFELYADDRNGTCREFNLNRTVMSDVQRERSSLLRKLSENGFDPKSASANANKHNDDIVRCVLACGLFPNVAEVFRGEIRGGTSGGENGGKGVTKGVTSTRHKAVVRDWRTGLEVAVHPSSVNGYQVRVARFPNPDTVYGPSLSTLQKRYPVRPVSQDCLLPQVTKVTKVMNITKD
jgi:HrpA-like RNA helicase